MRRALGRYSPVRKARRFRFNPWSTWAFPNNRNEIAKNIVVSWKRGVIAEMPIKGFEDVVVQYLVTPMVPPLTAAGTVKAEPTTLSHRQKKSVTRYITDIDQQLCQVASVQREG